MSSGDVPTRAMLGYQRLLSIRQELESGREVSGSRVSDLLGWFGETRRGFSVVREIEEQLEKLGLRTHPDFRDAYIEAELAWTLAAVPDEVTSVVDRLPATLPGPDPSPTRPGTVEHVDPSLRIGQLEAANQYPVTVAPSDNLSKAQSIMLMNDFSQVPVLQGARTIKGAVSWRSIGRAAMLRGTSLSLTDCLEQAPTVAASAPLFAALPVLLRHDYVLVVDKNGSVAGLVTTADISEQFRQLAEPFLLLQEVEQHVRLLLDGRLSVAELARFVKEGDGRTVRGIGDLTFGEYVRIVEHPATFERLDLPVDRALLVKRLHEVRRIRNDVMHFNADPFSEAELAVLRRFVDFLRLIVRQRGGN